MCNVKLSSPRRRGPPFQSEKNESKQPTAPEVSSSRSYTTVRLTTHSRHSPSLTHWTFGSHGFGLRPLMFAQRYIFFRLRAALSINLGSRASRLKFLRFFLFLLFFLLLDIEELLRFRPSAESLFFLLNFF